MACDRIHPSGHGKPGFAVIYLLIMFIALCALISLAVDYGRVTLDKAELQLACDAAARHGAMGLPTSSQIAYAQSAASANIVEGSPVTLLSSDIVTGTWNASTNVFTPTSSNPNAVSVSAQMTSARGNAISTPFASLLGFKACDIHASAVASVVAPVQTNVVVSGQADPWLAGMPDGTTANYYSEFGDCAPKNSPVQIPTISIVPGQTLNFQFSGTVSNWAGDNPYGCDGDPGYVGDDWWADSNGDSEHGIANVTAPIAAIIGVFLDDSQPDSSPAPASLDFSTAASQDFQTLSPLLKQPFFIGDGLRADGVTLQGFVVPPGATRLFVGIMDFQQWSDNSGTMTTTVTKESSVTLQK